MFPFHIVLSTEKKCYEDYQVFHIDVGVMTLGHQEIKADIWQATQAGLVDDLDQGSSARRLSSCAP